MFKSLKKTLGEDLPSLPERIMETIGAIVSVIMTVLIVNYFGLLSDGINLAIAFFTALPLAFSFIFGIITNNPSFESSFRKRSFSIYLIVTFILFMITARPPSLLDGVFYTFDFVIGFIIVLFSGFIYLWFYRTLKGNTYRMRALSSFLISTFSTLGIILILDYFHLLPWIG